MVRVFYCATYERSFLYCKHLSIDGRHDIEQCLNKQQSFREIGKMLNRDPTKISKEVVGHMDNDFFHKFIEHGGGQGIEIYVLSCEQRKGIWGAWCLSAILIHLLV